MKINPFENSAVWSLPADEVVTGLGTDIQGGLSDVEAVQRLAEVGKNRIEAPRRASRLKIFLRQFTSPLILVLIAATGVTIAIAHYRDAAFIFIAVAVNALLGFYQEDKAEQALAALDAYLKQRSRVVRGGVEREIDSEDVVPGDIIKLSQGDRVPADSRIVSASDLQIDEAVLTGESLPASKSAEAVSAAAVLGDRESMAFAGTLVTQGVCVVVACSTGKATEFGKIAEAIASTEREETPLQKAIKSFSVKASAVLGALTVVVFGVGIAVGYSFVDMFLTSVAIAVSAIPEGLPVALTVILSVGVQRMAKRKGVVRKLVAAEALGSTTVILTDKTGTLTAARMELTDVMPLGKPNEADVLRRGLACSTVAVENPKAEPAEWKLTGRIMETALVHGAAARGIRVTDIDPKDTVRTAPFNAVQKYSAAVLREKGGDIAVFFGAPDILLAHSTLPVAERREISEKIHSMASTGRRILGVAHAPCANKESGSSIGLESVVMDGLISFHDPVRPGVRDAVGRVTRAGIRTIVMTGDHRGTAQAIAREVGLEVPEGSALDASELVLLSEAELKERLPKLQVISRVTPFDKLRIVELYQKAGEIVAMTGDGVNDAPAIKRADVGIAMGSGTEVSRSVADLVLLDDNYETIVAAVEEGRQIMGNIRKVLVYLLSNVTDGLILIGGSLVVGLPLPLNALQILWVNFFSDSFPAIAFAFEKEKHVLSARPRKPSQSLFDPLMRSLILTIGLSTSALLFVLYWLLLRLGFDGDLVRTFIFAAFGSYTLFVALPVRSLERSIFSYPFFSNPFLLAGIGGGLILMAIAIYVPFLQKLFGTVALPWEWAVAVIALGLVNIGLIEIGKKVYRARN
ncbi:MAG TPA: HAD-IC family P-type ATPase [Candidatus Paceibacterota bacterium]